MITGDNPLTAVHVARDVEIVDREALILDIKENPKSESGMRVSPNQTAEVVNDFIQICIGALSTIAK